LGRFFSTCLQDLRKTSLLVASQEVLTADNEKVDHFLATCFRQTREPSKDALTGPEKKPIRGKAEVPRYRQAKR